MKIMIGKQMLFTEVLYKLQIKFLTLFSQNNRTVAD